MEDLSTLSPYRRLRARTAQLLFAGRRGDRASRFVDITLIVLISSNIIAVMLESIPILRRNAEDEFYAFELISVVIFTIEYIARVWSVVDNPWAREAAHPILTRLRYMVSWMALIDLIAIAPFYLGFFAYTDFLVLRALRLLRIFKLTRYSSAMTLLFQVLREEARTLGAAMFVSILLVFMASSFAYLAENRAQPEVFSSIPAAMYWAVVTMTTVGYGDVVPVTPWGKFLSAILGIIGLAMVALPAGILASGFNNAMHRRRAMLTERVEDALADGKLTQDEREDLEKLVEHLNLNTVDANAIIYAARHRMETAKSVCPHCGEPLVDEVLVQPLEHDT